MDNLLFINNQHFSLFFINSLLTGFFFLFSFLPSSVFKKLRFYQLLHITTTNTINNK